MNIYCGALYGSVSAQTDSQNNQSAYVSNYTFFKLFQDLNMKMYVFTAGCKH